LDYDITPEEIWTRIEAIHDLPFTKYDSNALWNQHATDSTLVVYADRVSDGLIRFLESTEGRAGTAFVYVWAPGQLTSKLDGGEIEIRSVHDALVQRFQQ
jgi:adenine-specific DNA-methyltransferase